MKILCVILLALAVLLCLAAALGSGSTSILDIKLSLLPLGIACLAGGILASKS